MSIVVLQERGWKGCWCAACLLPAALCTGLPSLLRMLSEGALTMYGKTPAAVLLLGRSTLLHSGTPRFSPSSLPRDTYLLIHPHLPPVGPQLLLAVRKVAVVAKAAPALQGISRQEMQQWASLGR